MSESISIFYSYAHEDERLRKKLEAHLALLQREGLITAWHDRNIGAGADWEREIDSYLNTAQIILLLVSANFLASNYCYGFEMKRAMERHDAGQARVIPIILRPVDWKGAPFSHLQALPTDGVPVIGRKWHNQDEAFVNIVQGIRKVIEELTTKNAPTTLRSKNENEQEVSRFQGAGNWGQNVNYLDFEVEIGEGRRQRYPIIIRSPAGEVRATMHFPFNELALENRLLALQNALLRSGEKRRQILLPEEQTVRDFGRDLFHALFSEQVRTLFARSRSEAAHQEKGLRIKLHVLSPGLAAIPWEFLYDSDQAEYLTLSRSTTVVRYIEQVQPPRPLTIDPPLRILGMIASPKDLEELNVEHERWRVERALAHLQSSGVVQLTWLEGQRWQDVQRSMRYGPWHVFHFIGHGGFDARMDEGILVFENDEGLAQPISATQLGRLLVDHYPLRLVVLNSCDGARGSQRDIFSSTAAILIRRNIPAVLAMQYEITDRAALLFSQVFYDALADNIPVDAAVNEARKAISIGIENSLEWGTPVLYMRSPDGNLFSISGTFPSYSDVPKSPSLSKNAETILSMDVSSIYVSTSLRSMPGNRATHITFHNPLEVPVDLYWLDEQGGEVWKYTLESGQYWSDQTYINHLWRVKNSLGKVLSEVLVTEDQQSIIIPPSLRSMDSSTPIIITFYNYSNSVINFYWLNYEGNEQGREQYSERPRIQLKPGQSHSELSFVSHPWRIKDDKGQILGEVVGLKNQQIVSVYSSSKKV